MTDFCWPILLADKISQIYRLYVYALTHSVINWADSYVQLIMKTTLHRVLFTVGRMRILHVTCLLQFCTRLVNIYMHYTHNKHNIIMSSSSSSSSQSFATHWHASYTRLI